MNKIQIANESGKWGSIALLLISTIVGFQQDRVQNQQEIDEAEVEVQMRTNMERDISANTQEHTRLKDEDVNLQEQINRLEGWREQDREAFQAFMLEYYRNGGASDYGPFGWEE